MTDPKNQYSWAIETGDIRHMTRIRKDYRKRLTGFTSQGFYSFRRTFRKHAVVFVVPEGEPWFAVGRAKELDDLVRVLEEITGIPVTTARNYTR